MTMIQFHILRNYAASNLNRDEIGAPKTAYFAGTQRGRISSQCLKRAWRSSEAFRNLNSFGIRTKYLPEIIAEKVKEYYDEETARFAEKNKGLFAKLGKNEKEKDKTDDIKETKKDPEGKTSQLMFFSKEDIDACVKAVLDANKDVKKLTEAIISLKESASIRPVTLDIALFGRMITDDKFADVDASLQVAHALSTNRVNQESDYFTAVDDLAADYNQDAGAGHLGDCDYNSCCYYEYASLDVDQLRNTLTKTQSTEALAKLPDLIAALLEAIVYSGPSGKQNSFAAHSLPCVICLEKKKRKIPVSYVNAFEEPVRSNYSVESSKRLSAEIDKMDSKFDTGIEERLWMDVNGAASPTNAQRISSFKELISIAASWIQ